MTKTTLLALTLATLPILASAATPPADLTPTTDVAVTYAVHAPGKPAGSMLVAWKADSGKVRVESLAFPGWLLLEPREQRASMIIEAQRAVVQMPPEVAVRGAPHLAADAVLTEAGTDTVAGLPCTQWDMTSAREGNGRICVTDNRLMLRMVMQVPGGESVRIEAERVAATPQDAARFAVPEGYTPMSATVTRNPPPGSAAPAPAAPAR